LTSVCAVDLQAPGVMKSTTAHDHVTTDDVCQQTDSHCGRTSAGLLQRTSLNHNATSVA